jgi:very-short-patch-repair endonuclease
MLRMNDHENTAGDYNRSRALRNNASPFEKKLWVALRKLAESRGLKFRRQQVVHSYIADFACMKARLLIELDGCSHDMRQGYDKVREVRLKKMGFTIVRFTNEDVAKNVEGVVMTILAQAEALLRNGSGIALRRAPLPNPPREGEGISASLVETEV